MPLDAGAVRRGCRGKEVTTARQLCRSELDRFRALARGAAALTVGCTQEAPFFSDVAAENGRTSPVSYANLREAAGWSSDGAVAGPKMAALLAAAAEPVPDVPLIDVESSDGRCHGNGRGPKWGNGKPDFMLLRRHPATAPSLRL